MEESAPFIPGESLPVIPTKLVKKIFQGEFVDMSELVKKILKGEFIDMSEAERRRYSQENGNSRSSFCATPVLQEGSPSVSTRLWSLENTHTRHGSCRSTRPCWPQSIVAVGADIVVGGDGFL